MNNPAMKKVAVYLVGAICLAFAALAGYTWITLNYSYSSGERVGYVQKLSQKGWLVKTWEGELQMLPVPGAVSEKFHFSVRSDSVAADINGMLGKKVSLAYEQHKGVPTTMFGESQYFVIRARTAE